MTIIKCKMCGGDLNVTAGMTVTECEYCGTKQTIPTVDNEKKLTLFARANRLRLACEFDKAAGVYEAIVADFPEEAEAYWGLVLCKYGIEYVDDPATGKKVPTCHRSSFDSVMDDNNFEMAEEYADMVARRVYRDEAKAIEEIRRGIIEVSGKEEPYDIFICYKETDPEGNRTLDSVLAQDIYDLLTEKKYRVFFSRITLEDKLGQEYEPYIFAALNSAKIMLVFGTDYEYFNAVWVKNEWSRYLQLMVTDKTKHLIPCYKGIDAYDMPKEFAKLQAQDLGKVGAEQDLLRGIEKLMPKEKKVVIQPMAQDGKSTLEGFLMRAHMSLEEDDFTQADSLCELALNQDPHNAEAYLCKLLSELRCKSREDLRNQKLPFEESANYQKILRYGEETLIKDLQDCNELIKNRNEEARLANAYQHAVEQMNAANDEKSFRVAAKLFSELFAYKDAEEKEKECLQKADGIRAEAKKRAKKQQKIIGCILGSVCVVVCLTLLIKMVILPMLSYNAAVKLMNSGRYDEAITAFSAMDGYKDSNAKIEACREGILQDKYDAAKLLLEQGKYEEAIKAFEEIRNFQDASIQIDDANKAILQDKYDAAKRLLEQGKYKEAIAAFEEIRNFRDASSQIDDANKAILQIQYDAALLLKNNAQYEEAIAAFSLLNDYKDSLAQIEACHTAILQQKYDAAKLLLDEGKYKEAVTAFEEIREYKDAELQLNAANELLWRNEYNTAISRMNNGAYEEAVVIFSELVDYKDSLTKIVTCYQKIFQKKYDSAKTLMNQGNSKEAIRLCEEICNFQDDNLRINVQVYTSDEIWRIQYDAAVLLMNCGAYEEAIAAFTLLNGYKDSDALHKECQYLHAVNLMNRGTYEEAISAFTALLEYKDSAALRKKCQYNNAVTLMDSGQYQEAMEIFHELGEYLDSYENYQLACRKFYDNPNMVFAKQKDYPYLVVNNGVLTVTDRNRVPTHLVVPHYIDQLILRIGTFMKCDTLISITIPNSVAEIASYAFNQCSNLTSVTIPTSITSIGNYAFYLCKNLTRVTFEGTMEQWNQISKKSSGLQNLTVYCTDGTVTWS